MRWSLRRSSARSLLVGMRIMTQCWVLFGKLPQSLFFLIMSCQIKHQKLLQNEISEVFERESLHQWTFFPRANNMKSRSLCFAQNQTCDRAELWLFFKILARLALLFFRISFCFANLMILSGMYLCLLHLLFFILVDFTWGEYWEVQFCSVIKHLWVISHINKPLEMKLKRVLND